MTLGTTPTQGDLLRSTVQFCEGRAHFETGLSVPPPRVPLHDDLGDPHPDTDAPG